ncbi:MAG: alkane 1-monooxygenase [Flavobacteriaceae bacterium]|nr:alkane 1-monooxygenase [Flavobacteriaceae bacterium]
MLNDLKYLFAYTIPLSTFVSIFSDGILTFATPIYAFILVPILEILMKDYDTQYDDDQKNKRLSNHLFDILLYLNIPFVFVLLFFGFYNLTNTSLMVYEKIGILSSLGILLATNAINVAHELGHRKSQTERTLSKILYIPCLYMHFYIEHNFGHHKNVATPQDPATSKFNQSVYSFWVTSISKGYFNAWRVQKKILNRSKKRFISFQNDMLWYLIIQFIYLYSIFFIFDFYGLLYAIIVAIQSFLFLETINYIEHYGLVRKKLKSGRYERVQTHHSWNSNHIIGRIVLYELTRHSDHHFKSSKKYQILENKKDSPQLPFGYPTSILLALFPPLWFKIINPKLKLLLKQ